MLSKPTIDLLRGLLGQTTIPAAGCTPDQLEASARQLAQAMRELDGCEAALAEAWLAEAVAEIPLGQE